MERAWPITIRQDVPSDTNPRYRAVPQQLRILAVSLLEERGIRGGARELGIGRTAFVGICAGLHVQPGTLALVREAIKRREEWEAEQRAVDEQLAAVSDGKE